jgi:hypothetical protein
MWNMEYKARTVPLELQLFEILHTRTDLGEKEKQNYFNLKKGFEGELRFDSFTSELTLDCLILNDLLLKAGNNTFQIDTLLIADTIYIYEVKNFEGDFYYKDDRLLSQSNYEVSNPLTQLSRAESLLRQLLQSIGITTSINSSVVFINPAFTLYQAPINKPIIYPTQLNRYMKQLNSVPSRIGKKHKALADKLISLHLTESPYQQLPEYEYGDLRKGVVCSGCKSYGIEVQGMKVICKSCGGIELVEDAVMRSVEEFRLLFPSERVTTRVIQEWCKLFPEKRVSRILHKHFNPIGVSRWVYYE